MNSTPAQLQAIAATGNVVLVAGAGTGKTQTLVERCLHCLLELSPPASLDEILMVTFTEAAAAEMRQRIRHRLEEQLKRAPSELRWHEQLALFESAHIGTLHSFCLKVVRQHFYELELDPNLAVLPEEEARLLAEETLDTLFQKHYAGETPAAVAVQELIQIQGKGLDDLIRSLVIRLHRYTQTLPDPSDWFRDQLQNFSNPEPHAWRIVLDTALAEWRARWLTRLRRDYPGNDLAGRCAALLEQMPATAVGARTIATLQEICATGRDLPRGKKGAWGHPLKEFLAETTFLTSLTGPAGEHDPLAEDWSWVRTQMVALLDLAAEFAAGFSQAKRELGAVDFHDLEQHALRLLWDSAAGQPTRIGREWRQKLRFVFVDEYQDINAAQDKIIEAISRDDARGNRFLVGDVKQSIYRFRLADPHIFQRYADDWTGPAGTSIPLVDNFRSRESILDFINSFFSMVMSPEIGGVAYDDRARLRFGAPAERQPLSDAASPERCVELHLRLRGSSTQPEFEEIMEGLPRIADLREADKEARLVALRLAELKRSRHPVWDESSKHFRPVEWSDMAVLLRSPSGKAESYAKEFSRLKVPLLVTQGGFYESLEIRDLLSLLQVLDNPLQDIPLLAVLHSPLVGLTVNELASIRLVNRGPFWKALLSWKTSQPEPATEPGANGPSTRRKVIDFFAHFAAWRRLARRVSLSQCLETVLSETHYASWLLAQPRGQQRHANVQRLLALARQFDRFQRQGLFRFLKFVEAQRLADTQPEVAPACEENAVRLMSIHQSKGLEFPVAAVADLGKAFNLDDLRSEIILDEKYGLCPQIKPPHTGRRYPSLPYWLARQRQLRETLGEEARLLYVAMTRARDLLVLTASLPQATFTRRWLAPEPVTTETLAAAGHFSDWLGQWFAQHSPNVDPAAARGQNSFLRWTLHDDSSLVGAPPAIAPESAQPEMAIEADQEQWGKVLDRLSWRYPFPAATRQPAKTSVTALRRRAAELDEAAPFALPAAPFDVQPKRVRPRLADSRIASEIGRAHHAFLQRLSFDAVGSRDQLQAQGQALVRASVLTLEQVGLLDYDGLAAFWDSELGREIRAQSQWVQRELVFTARFTPAELAQLTGEPLALESQDEFVVVQGVVDLAVITPSEIRLVDFKTDAVDPGDLPLKLRIYEPQLKLYTQALSRIFKQPVTGSWLYFLAARTAVRVGDR